MPRPYIPFPSLSYTAIYLWDKKGEESSCGWEGRRAVAMATIKGASIGRRDDDDDDGVASDDDAPLPLYRRTLLYTRGGREPENTSVRPYPLGGFLSSCVLSSILLPSLCTWILCALGYTEKTVSRGRKLGNSCGMVSELTNFRWYRSWWWWNCWQWE